MTMLLYISVCLRTRQDTISYSFIYIIQKAEFQGKNRGNIGLESGEQGTGIRGKQGTGNRRQKSGEKQGNRGLETGERNQGKNRGTGDWKQETEIRGKKSGEKNRGLETGERNQGKDGIRGKMESGEKQGNRGLESGEKNRGLETGERNQGNRGLESGETARDWMY